MKNETEFYLVNLYFWILITCVSILNKIFLRVTPSPDPSRPKTVIEQETYS